MPSALLRMLALCSECPGVCYECLGVSYECLARRSKCQALCNVCLALWSECAGIWDVRPSLRPAPRGGDNDGPSVYRNGTFDGPKRRRLIHRDTKGTEIDHTEKDKAKWNRR